MTILEEKQRKARRIKTTIDKAIKILEIELHLAERQPETGINNALDLGIEALKRLNDGRSKGYDYFGHLLPGETQEVTSK